MADPVEIVARSLWGRLHPSEMELLEAGEALGEVVADGWRLVRTEPVKPVWGERDWRVIDEWTPEAVPAEAPAPSDPPTTAEEKVVDLMAALEESVREAKEARARHRAVPAEEEETKTDA